MSEGCRSQFGECPRSVGIFFITRVAEERVATIRGECLNGAGMNVNTRVSEGCRSQFGVCPPIMRVLILIPVMC